MRPSLDASLFFLLMSFQPPFLPAIISERSAHTSFFERDGFSSTLVKSRFQFPDTHSRARLFYYGHMPRDR